MDDQVLKRIDELEAKLDEKQIEINNLEMQISSYSS